MNKKISESLIIGTSVLFLIAALAAVIFFTFQINLAGNCENELLKKLVSPDGKYAAVVFERSCGATTGFSTQVSILPIRESLGNDESGNAFVCDSNLGAAPPGAGGGPEVRIEWITNQQLEITHHQRAGVFLKKDWLEGISISYGTFP